MIRNFQKVALELRLMKSVMSLEMLAAKWTAKLPSIMDRYTPKETVYGDKTGQLFHTLPRKAEKVLVEDFAKKGRVFICGFMTGEIEKLLAAGKAAKP